MIAQLDKEYIKTKPYKVYSRFISYLLFEGRPLTTPGQWINPIVFANYQLSSKIPSFKKVEKPIFILGTGRSGSTIVGKLLSMHSKVGFLNEPKALWHFLHPNEDLIGSYSREKANYYLDGQEATPKLIQKAHRVYSWFLTLSGSKRVVDKYPELIFRYDFVKKIFPDAKFIFLVRNGWDCCVSVDNWSEKKGIQANGEVHDWWGADNRKWNLLIDQVVGQDTAFSKEVDSFRDMTNQSDMAALEWIMTMKQGLKLIKEKKDVYTLNYEDLISNTESTLYSLLDYCELNKDEKQLRYANSVLRSPSPKDRPALNALVLNEFSKIQKILGYSIT